MTLKESYFASTPKKWKKIGDSILIGTSGLAAIMMGSPLPDHINIWVVFCLNATGVIGKIITNFFTEDAQVEPVNNDHPTI